MTYQLLILFRNMGRNKTYSILNIFGLAVGIACASFIFLWVENELSFNHHFTKRNSIYAIMQMQETDGKTSIGDGGPLPMAADIKNSLPGIKNIARIGWENKQLFVDGDKSIRQMGQYADPAILSILDFDFIYGRHPSLLSPESIIISESMSRAFFGNENPVGKTLATKSESIWTKDGNFTITGVFKDFPANCSYSFNWLSPFKIYEDLLNPEWNKWGINIPILIETEPEADVAKINKSLKNYMASKVQGSKLKSFLFSMNDWNLYSQFGADGKPINGKIKHIYLFSIIAGLILIIACINFMNLSTARSEQRAREVGVRKVVGAGRMDLIWQFIGESLTMSFLSAAAAALIISVSIPAFNSLIGKELQADLFKTSHLVFLVLVGLVCGLLSGIYPAFYLSSFKPALVLKGLNIRNSISSVVMRKGLVISQFAISITLIISTITIYQQVQYVKSRNIGYNINNLLEVVTPQSLSERFPTVRAELLKSGFVENAALTWSEPLYIHSSSDEYMWEEKLTGANVQVYDMGVSPEYVSTMNMKIKRGRDFYTDADVDVNRSIIINETLAKLMGAQGRIGSYISRKSPAVRFQIVGIVEDFVFNDMYGSGGPVMISCMPKAGNHMIIHFKNGSDLNKALAKMQETLNTFIPGYPFEYKFVDETFNKIFETETLIGKLVTVFSILAILISCFGLFGLAAYTAQRRTKEIGIRKLMGASISSLASLLSFEFLKLVIISCVIAVPVAWWALHSWLQNFQYRTVIQWWSFLLAIVIALLIAVVTVSYQAVKAAIINPVKSLRTE